MRGKWLVATGLMLAACERQEPETPDPYDVVVGPYEADIRWTTYGIPHISASNFGSLGYGLGFAFARDHGCVLADQLVKVHGERSKYFGAGDQRQNLDADFGWKALRVKRDAERVWTNLEPRVQDVLIGYAAGYSEWVADGASPSACAGEPWVREVDHLDLLSYMLALVLDGSGAVFVPEIGRGVPPTQNPPPPPGLDRLAEISGILNDPKRGSNGWAIGSDRAANGGSLLLSNTHFPAVGEKQWHEVHLTIPGELDVYGVSLMGVPVVNMGFNAHVAWTHTVSFAPRFVAYMLVLDPADPTRYAYGDEWVKMSSETYEVEVLGEDRVLGKEQRTLYRSHHGPVLEAPGFGWTPALAIAIKDINTQNIGAFDVWLGMNTATSLDDLIDAHRRTAGTPWVYTIAAGKDGEVFFGDTSRVPYLDDEAIAAWRTLRSGGTNAFVANTFADFGVIAVDASDPVFDLTEHPSAAVPGVVPFDLAPTDVRSDYVFNANDSHWLHNASEPLEGYSEALFGAEGTARSARTRMNARYLHETGEGSASGEDGLFTLEEVESAALSMRSSLVEVALEEVVDRCTERSSLRTTDDEVIDLTEACSVLAAWDGQYTLQSPGAVLWREFLGSGQFDAANLNAGGGGLFVNPFDPEEPLSTPNTLVSAEPPLEGDPDIDPVLRSLGRAVTAMAEAGWALDATLEDHQFMPFADGSEVPVPGAGYWEGTIGIADYSGGASSTLMERYARGEVLNPITERTADGYPVNNGNSWIMAVEMGEDGPNARAVLTYSQSEVASSDHLLDQTSIYASGSLRDVYFEEADIAANVVEQVTLTRP